MPLLAPIMRLAMQKTSPRVGVETNIPILEIISSLTMGTEDDRLVRSIIYLIRGHIARQGATLCVHGRGDPGVTHTTPPRHT